MSKKKQEQNARKRNKKLQEPQEAPEADFSALDLMKSPRLDQFHAPDGFRAVPFLQAVMGFAEPFQDFLESDSEEEMEQMMDVAMNVWNFSGTRCWNWFPVMCCSGVIRKSWKGN